eukprot:scaffold20473_cov41-Prasinocladus_malaysianus.AAC.1
MAEHNCTVGNESDIWQELDLMAVTPVDYLSFHATDDITVSSVVAKHDHSDAPPRARQGKN